MPASRRTTPVKTPTSPPGSTTKVGTGWTKDQKSMLFNHVLRVGETNWKVAVPGKTGHQCQEQWKKTLLPFIRRSCGF